jgi:hypothetical protein
MNQTSFEYAILSNSVAAELESLRAEKQQLAENIRQTEQRLSDISLREEKLARFSESLTDLLTVYPANGQNQATLSSTSESENPAVPETSPEIQTNESAPQINEEPVIDAGAALLNSENTSPVESSVPDSESEGEIAESPVTNNREFDKGQFLDAYPHLRNAQQPIHVLAEKLLEYFGRPTKLRDLTQYILELGYRHHSQNFTNTVHTVLKNKRERNGSFYFDPQERMWELGHWRSASTVESVTTNKATESDSETVEQPVVQVNPRKSQEKSDETKTVKAVSRKNATLSKIKLIKAAGRKL